MPGDGRHCFVEKPLTVSVADGLALAAAGAAAGCTVQVGHIFRFHPVTCALGRALVAGRIGRLLYAMGRFSGFKRPRTDVGVTHADAIHYSDAAGRRRGRIGQQIGAMEYGALKDHAPGREVGRERAGEETPELIRGRSTVAARQSGGWSMPQACHLSPRSR